MALSARTLWAGRVLLCAAPLIVVGGVADLLGAPRPAAERMALALAAALAFAIWLWFWLRAIDAQRPLPARLAVAILTVLGAALTLQAGPGRDALLFAAAAAGAGLPPPRALYAVAGVALLAAVVQLIDQATVGGALGTAFNELLVGLAAAGGRMLVLTNRELVAARGEVERLAVSEERLRFARDLHDLIGQSLTFAVLKSELLMRQLPADGEGGGRAQLAEVAATMRDALDDVRRAAAGYRQPGLAEELATARSRLASAGIRLELSDDLGRVPVQQEAVLAWAVREGVANVLRHSGATACALRLDRASGTVRMELVDDGPGRPESERPHADGSGLAGIAERARALGGSSTAGRAPEGGFRLQVTLPVRP